MALFVGIEDFLLIQFNDCVQNILISAIKTTGYALSEQEEEQETRTTTQIKKNLHLVTSHKVPLTQLFIHSFIQFVRLRNNTCLHGKHLDALKLDHDNEQLLNEVEKNIVIYL